MKIGITLGLQSENESMWVNGIKLNVVLLANALQYSGKHEVYIVDTSTKVQDLTKVAWDTNRFKTVKFKDIHKELDILITLGTSLTTEMMESFKSQGPNKRVVKYQAGNSYVIEMERVIFGDNDTELQAPWDHGGDAVWYVPQQGYQNHHYYKTIYRTDNVMPVPFVWDPMFLDKETQIYSQLNRKLPFYQPGPQEAKRLSVFEPNLNVVKYALVPIMAAENVHRRGVDFDTMFVANGNKLLKNKYFMSMVKKFDIVSGDKIKIKFTPRYPVCHYLAETTDIVVSHQWENPLNYSYLDVLYFDFPLVHNADMIQDGGYYYPDFDITKAADQLQYALQHHDDNIEEYRAKNQPVLDRYTVKNEAMVDVYDKLIDNLYSNKHDLSYQYDWKTNLYK